MGSLNRLFQEILTPGLASGNFKVKIETQLLPTINLDIQKILNSPPNPVLRAAKPKITITSAGFGLDKTLNPWGEPSKNYFPAVIGSAILFVLTNFYIGYLVGSGSKI